MTNLKQFEGLKVLRSTDENTRPEYVRVAGEKYRLWCNHSRYHFRVNDYIVKVSGAGDYKMSGGQNERELYLWQDLEDCDRKYFAPIVAFGGSTEYYDVEWLVMPFYKKANFGYASDADSRRADLAYSKIRYLLGKYDIDDLGTWPSGNWLVCRNGLPKIVDYGWGGNGRSRE